MRKILLLVWLVLFVCRPAAANPVTIEGVGQVELGQGILVTEGHNKKGEINYGFKVKDGAVWRGATLLPITSFSSNGTENMIKLDVFLDKIIDEKVRNSENILAAEKARKVILGGKECATTSIKMEIPGGGIVANMEMIIIPGADGLKMFGFMCSDSDAQYWRPIMLKIAASIL